MTRKNTARRVLLAALALMLLGGLMTPHKAFADGDKGVKIGPIVVTPDPPKKK